MITEGSGNSQTAPWFCSLLWLFTNFLWINLTRWVGPRTKKIHKSNIGSMRSITSYTKNAIEAKVWISFCSPNK
jgi:hypothetical protein